MDVTHGLPKRSSVVFAYETSGAAVNKLQLNAIQRHMWPIGIIPPTHVIGWILTMADNMSSFNEGVAMLKEKIHRRKGED